MKTKNILRGLAIAVVLQLGVLAGSAPQPPLTQPAK